MLQILKTFIILSLLRWFLYEEQRRIQNPKMERFYEKTYQVLTVDYFDKTFHLRCWQGFEYASGKRQY